MHAQLLHDFTAVGHRPRSGKLRKLKPPYCFPLRVYKSAFSPTVPKWVFMKREHLRMTWKSIK